MYLQMLSQLKVKRKLTMTWLSSKFFARTSMIVKYTVKKPDLNSEIKTELWQMN